MVLGAIQYDSPGQDDRSTRSLNAEWVTVKNTGRLPVNIKGWPLSDKSGHSYRFGNLRLHGHSRSGSTPASTTTTAATSIRTVAPTSGTTPATPPPQRPPPRRRCRKLGAPRPLIGSEPAGELCRSPATTVRRSPVPAARRCVPRRGRDCGRRLVLLAGTRRRCSRSRRRAGAEAALRTGDSQ
ncbi:lamin tail domain-containing protein [Streptomyces sp. C10]|uniref:lamin tail domain-containing protein n=1 Tax=Streptomyces sp. C10 TaxID=531941 RepID=UPI00398101CF